MRPPACNAALQPASATAETIALPGRTDSGAVRAMGTAMSRAGKAMVYAVAEAGWSAALKAGDRIYEPVYLSEDAQEGPRAFREQRQPVWKAR